MARAAGSSSATERTRSGASIAKLARVEGTHGQRLYLRAQIVDRAVTADSGEEAMDRSMVDGGQVREHRVPEFVGSDVLQTCVCGASCR
jgi:hypothetical protein